MHTRYEGKGGIPIGGFGMRLAAALRTADRNILLTGYLTPESRMMIHRDVRQRLRSSPISSSGISDPYLVITDDGRLVWMLDGYTTSARASLFTPCADSAIWAAFNYIRNSVKATVDAYDGIVKLYVFDSNDPIIRAWQAMFPTLFKPASEMPADAADARPLSGAAVPRAGRNLSDVPHAGRRKPSTTRKTCGMWRRTCTRRRKPTEARGADLRGRDAARARRKPEFLLMQSVHAAQQRQPDRGDGGALRRRASGRIVVLQLSKQSLIYGPLQIEARIGSDQTISKDLSLWNQQGSQVLRGQMLVLPIDNTFLFVEPIYIQASQARMPQLKKVVLAMGNTLIYRDTYEQALAELTGKSPRRRSRPGSRPHVYFGCASATCARESSRRQTWMPCESMCDGIGNYRLKEDSRKRAKNWKRWRNLSAGSRARSGGCSRA